MNDVVQKGGSFRKEQSLPKDRVSEQIWFPRTLAKQDFQTTGLGSTLLRE